VFNIIVRKKRARGPTVFKLIEFSINCFAIYVNIKKGIEQ